MTHKTQEFSFENKKNTSKSGTQLYKEVSPFHKPKEQKDEAIDTQHRLMDCDWRIMTLCCLLLVLFFFLF